MSLTIDIRELAGRIDEALEHAANGDEVILADGNVPKVRLVPCVAAKPRVPDLHPGFFQPAPDFDEPLPDDFWLGES